MPMQIGIPERQTHDYVCHGAITLFVALDIATGKVTGLRKPRHREAGGSDRQTVAHSCGYQTHFSVPRSSVRDSRRWSRLTV
jgi:hypothetical protein